jgi:sigma-B regulation protein RsbU (phosphoserine phosphatase)
MILQAINCREAELGLSISVASRCSTTERLRGGDVFEVCTNDRGSSTLLLADISSRSGQSRLHCDVLRQAFLRSASRAPGPSSILQVLNAVRFDNANDPFDIIFACAIVVTIKWPQRELTYASAGHDVALIFGGSKHRHLGPTGPALGLLPDASYGDCAESFDEDDLLLLATAGFTECGRSGNDHRRFGATGIVRAAAADVERSCRSVSRAVVSSADSFTGGSYLDDATLAVIRREI